MSNFTEYPAPDGKYHILLAANEMRMSHWIESAALWRTGDTTACLSIGDYLWSADSVKWSEDSSHVTLEMRRYPGNKIGLTVTLFPENGEATVQTPNGSETVPFSMLSRHMDACHSKMPMIKRLPG